MTCPDSLPFEWTVPANTVYSPWQADANARANALACQRAREARVCITTETLSPVCVGTFYGELLNATGGVSPYTWALTSGSLPAGLTLDPSAAVILGTPTTPGTSAFSVTVTDAVGSTQTKPFTLLVAQITTASPLPTAIVSDPYSQALAVSPAFAAPNWVVTAGTLPPGLFLGPDGVLAGTPSTADTYTFTVEVQESDVAVCQKQFTIEVESVVALLAYWTFDDYIINNRILDSGPNGFDILYATSNGTIEPGIVNNCFRSHNPVFLQVSGGDFSLFDNCAATGFTLCGWIKLAPADNTGDGQIWNQEWNTPSTDLALILRNADLVVELNGNPDILYPYPQDSDWHFYRLWYDPADSLVRLQLDNGAILSTGPITFATGTGGNINFAGNAIFAGSTERAFDETGFWKRPLTDTEAASLWNGGTGNTWPTVPP